MTAGDTTRLVWRGGRRWLADDWWPWPLPDNVTIDEPCYLGSTFAFLRFASERPQAVRVGHHTGVYDTMFDLGPDGEVQIGPWSTLVSPIVATNGRVVIGSHALIADDVVIADLPVASPGGDPRRSADEPEPVVVVGDNVWLAERAVLLAGARVGDDAIVAAAAVVDGEVPPGAIVAGDPLRVVGSTRA